MDAWKTSFLVGYPIFSGYLSLCECNLRKMAFQKRKDATKAMSCCPFGRSMYGVCTCVWWIFFMVFHVGNCTFTYHTWGSNGLGLRSHQGFLANSWDLWIPRPRSKLSIDIHTIGYFSASPDDYHHVQETWSQDIVFFVRKHSYYYIYLFLHMQIHRFEASTDKKWLLSLGARHLDLINVALPISNQPAPHIFQRTLSEDVDDLIDSIFDEWIDSTLFAGASFFYSAPLGSGEIQQPWTADRIMTRKMFFLLIGKWFETETETCGFPGRGDDLQSMICSFCVLLVIRGF